MGGFLNPMLSVYRNQLEAPPRPSEDNPQDSSNAMLEQLQRLPPQVQQSLFQKYPELRQRISVGQGGPMGRPVPGSAAGLQPRGVQAGSRHQSAAAGSGLTGATAGGGNIRQSQGIAPARPKYQSPIGTQQPAPQQMQRQAPSPRPGGDNPYDTGDSRLPTKGGQQLSLPSYKMDTLRDTYSRRGAF